MINKHFFLFIKFILELNKTLIAIIIVELFYKRLLPYLKEIKEIKLY